MKEITLTIDDKQCKGKEGDTVLDICRANGIYVPTLCHREGVSNTGACRMCLVEIEGIALPQTACSMLAAEGMKVKTNTEKLRDTRKINLELILAERPHFCMFCPKSGDCELQNLAYEYGISHVRFPYIFNRLPIDTSHPYLIMDPHHCILCGRCIRTCQEVVGNCTLGFKERGWETTVAADLSQPLGESSCISCGACSQACPVGAISNKYSMFMGKEKDCETTRTLCPLCGQGCEIDALVRGGNLVKIKGAKLTSSDGGQLCGRGRYSITSETRSRVTKPLVRNSQGKLEETTWKKALDFTAEKLKTLKLKSEAGAIAGLISSQSPAEDIIIFREFMNEAVGSNAVDTLDGTAFRNLSAAIAALRKESPQVSIDCDSEDFLKADRIVVVGSDPIRTHPVVAAFIRRAALAGAKVLTIDSEKDSTRPWTTLHLKPKRGTEWLLIGGLINILSQKAATKKKADVQLPRDLNECSPSRVCQNSGVRMEDLERGVDLLKPKGVVFVCDPSRLDSKAMISLLNLASMKSSSSKKALKVLFLPPQGNSLAAWKLKGPAQVDLAAAGQKKMKAAYVVPSDEKVSDEVLKSLKEMDLVIAHCSYHSPLDSVAHVILPVPIWAERDGVYLTLDGKVMRQPSFLEPPAKMKGNWWILTELAKRLGSEMKYQKPKSLVPEAKKRLKAEGLF